MSLHPSNTVATALDRLDAAGIAIVLKNEAWFIQSYTQLAGPYDTAEAALEQSMRWLSENKTRRVGEQADK